LLLGPRFRGDDELACPQDFLTASTDGSARIGLNDSPRSARHGARCRATGRWRAIGRLSVSN